MAVEELCTSLERRTSLRGGNTISQSMSLCREIQFWPGARSYDGVDHDNNLEVDGQFGPARTKDRILSREPPSVRGHLNHLKDRILAIAIAFLTQYVLIRLQDSLLYNTALGEDSWIPGIGASSSLHGVSSYTWMGVLVLSDNGLRRYALAGLRALC